MMVFYRFLGGLLSGLLRRLLGGWLSTKEILSERGVQWVIGGLLYACGIAIKVYWDDGYDTWLYDLLPLYLFIPLAAASVVLCLTTGHFPGFMCGTESQEYIDEQVAKGRTIKFEKLVDWLGEKRGFAKWGKEWCFWQLLCCKVYACIFPAFFLGWHFLILGSLVAFVYPAMFWTELKASQRLPLSSPTNWGEWWQGYFIVWGLLC